jgi:hypothetical protein
MYTHMIRQRRKVFGSGSIAVFSPSKTRLEMENGDVDTDAGPSYAEVAAAEPPPTARKGRKKTKAL